MAVDSFVLSKGSGFIFQTLLADILLGIVVGMLTKLVVLPISKQYQLIKSISQQVPGPKPHWLWGNMIKHDFSDQGLKNTVERAQKFPYYCTQWLSPFRGLLLLYHPATVKPFLIKAYPKSDAYKITLRPILRNGLVTSSGPVWKRHRRLLTPIFNFDVLKSHLVIFNKNCDDFVEWVGENANTGVTANFTLPISNLAYNDVMECVMSQKAISKSGKTSALINLLNEITELMMKRANNFVFYIDAIWYATPWGRGFKKCQAELIDECNQITNERRKLRSKADDDESSDTKIVDEKNGKVYSFKRSKGKSVDFLDILIQTKDENGVGLTNEEIIDEVITFFGAAQETTAYSTGWAFHLLAKNLDCQQKCRDEINEVLGEKQDVEWSDMNKLPYLTKCIKETLRMYSILHFVGRKMNEDVTIPDAENPDKSILIKKNVNVGINIYALHHNPHVWPNPNVFDPERFSIENSKDRSPYAFLPFSAGPRNCIGQHFAMHKMRVSLCKVLRKYEVYRDPDAAEPLLLAGITIKPIGGIHLKIRHLKE